MQILAGKAMERRTFLRGLGASLALPYLDAMEPAVRSLRKFGGASAATEKTRLVCMSIPRVSHLVTNYLLPVISLACSSHCCSPPSPSFHVTLPSASASLPSISSFVSDTSWLTSVDASDAAVAA